jgi:predicted SprT family Zn-dependent metalloprotease
MKPTITQMNKWFEEFNKKVFDGKLPKVPIKFNNTYRQLGQFYWGPTRGIGIKISLFYDRTEEQYRNCLLHEMCHLYCYQQGWKHEGHGPRWKAIADKAYRITGLYIQRCENTSGWQPTKGNGAKAKAVKQKRNAPAILVDIDYGTYHFIVKTTKNVLWDATNHKGEVKAVGGGKVLGVYISDDSRFVRWSNSRSMNRGYKFGFLEYEKSIKPMLKKAIKVDDLRKLCHWGEYDCLGVR